MPDAREKYILTLSLKRISKGCMSTVPRQVMFYRTREARLINVKFDEAIALLKRYGFCLENDDISRREPTHPIDAVRKPPLSAHSALE